MSKRYRKKRYSVILAAVLCGIALFCLSYRLIEKKYVYRTPYHDAVRIASKDYGVSESVIYAVMKSESSFRLTVVSPKGAVGLMQLLPSTAEFIAKKLDEEYVDGSLLDPAVNIKYGTWYLSYLFAKFSPDAAIAAYNAGEGKVSSWLKNPKYSSNGKTLDVIPYAETAKYVRRVNKNISKYNKYHG